MSNVIVISHKSNTQPDDDLVLYLKGKKEKNVMHITHAFSDSPNRVSTCVWYKDGTSHKVWKSGDYEGYPEATIYLKEIIFTLKCILRSKIYWDTCVCMDGLCALYGMLGRIFMRVKRIVYWAIDFVPSGRFKSKTKNFIYKSINVLGYKKADEMWDLSPRMVEARKKFLGIKLEDYKKHKVVPYGVWIERIKKYPYEECEKNTLVFMGHLIEKQGVQLVLQAVPQIVKRNPNFKFKVIGKGRYKDRLKQMVSDLRIERYVNFMEIEEDTVLEEEIAKSCVAIAPYIKNLDTWTYYADPGKVKKYLGCGVPVLLTDIPWNAREIEEEGCGKIISEDLNVIVDSVLGLMDGDVNQRFRDSSNKYAKSFDYQKIFSELI
ncbi:glycosyltransferase [candidate division WWE3 bacterium]|uniref:Glycosyltransferase n=1 Tax=candidate division WWE3 bacterium TaxID=2053526 RepID=A0A7X9HSM1_UNCKA|nr:glycosyltransferase [candidate division WWE3 bacterium]